MRTLVFGDLHGAFEKFNELLKRVNYNIKDDTLILLGDAVDYGRGSLQGDYTGYNVKNLISRLVEIKAESKKFIYIMGNHDDWFREFADALSRSKVPVVHSIWYNQGGKITLQDYELDNPLFKQPDAPSKIPLGHLELFDEAVYWHEDNNFLYTHGGMTFWCSHPKDETKANLMWDRSLVQDAVGPQLRHLPKPMVVGHSQTEIYTGKCEPIVTKNCIAIDTGGGYGKSLTCMEIDDETGNYKFYQSKE